MAALADRLAARRDTEQARILIVDIERLPGLARVWDQRTNFIPVSQWTRLPSLLCFAAKWHGSKSVEFYSAWDDPDSMVQRSWELYDAADIVVTYNGIKFDNRHLRSEWLLEGMVQPRPWKNVDLYAVNRSAFGFESKSLAHLCHRLGLPGKSGHYDAVMAEKCLEGDLKSQRTMKRYNVGDVKITEGAYDKLLPWISNHPHVRTSSGDTLTCNRCGCDELTRLPTDYRANVMDYAQYRCDRCGGIVRAGHVRRVARTRGVA